MAWDDTKGAGNVLLSAEWNTMVADQKSRAVNEDEYHGEVRLNSKYTQAIVTFQLDDNYDDDLDFLTIFNNQSEVACCTVQTDDMETAGHLTWSELQQLADAGWEIMSHSVDHSDLTTLSESDLRDQLQNSKTALEAQGHTIHNIAYPYGSENALVRKVTREYYRSGRSGYNIINPIILDSYRLYSFAIDDVGTEVATYKAAVDDAIAGNRWVIFFFHSQNMDATDKTKLDELIDYIQAASVPILTTRAALDLIGNMIDMGDQFAVHDLGLRLADIYSITRYHTYATINEKIRIDGGGVFTPFGGFGEKMINSLVFSESFDNASWDKTDCTITADDAVAPDGSSTADRLTVTDTSGKARQLVSITDGDYVCGSVWLKAAADQTVYLTLTEVAGNIAVTVCGVTTEWQRFIVSGTKTDTGASYIVISPNYGESSGYCWAWGAQLCYGADTTYGDEQPYVKTENTTFVGDYPGIVAETVSGRALQIAGKADVDEFVDIFSAYGGLGERAVNYLLNSEDFSSTWTVNNVTVTTNNTTAPDGRTTADKIDGTVIQGYIRQFYAASVGDGDDIRFSVWLKADSTISDTRLVLLGAEGNITVLTITVTTEWQRFHVTGTKSGAGWLYCYIYPTYGGTDHVYAWGAQMIFGSDNSEIPYVKTTDERVVVDSPALVAADAVVAGGDIVARGGFKQPFNFMQSNVAASQTDVQLDVLGLAGNTEIVMPYAGSVIGISVASNAARSAGTLTVEPSIDGTGTGLTAQLDDDPTQYASATQAKDTDTFTAGQRLGVEITTDGSWAPTTADIVVTVIVEM